MDDGEIQPALPKLVTWPGGWLSTRLTSKPAFCKCQAQLEPTMPAPTTMHVFLVTRMLPLMISGDYSIVTGNTARADSFIICPRTSGIGGPPNDRNVS